MLEKKVHIREKKYLEGDIGSVILLLFCFITIITSIFLFIEYRFYHHQAEKMLALKEEYRAYVLAVKKVMNDYNKTRERLDELEAMIDNGKKNTFDILELVVSQTMFPDGARVFSSDDTEDDDEVPFVIINRELEYLKQSTLDYFKTKNLAYLFQHTDVEEWSDYTQQLLEHRDKITRRKVISRRKKVATSGIRPKKYEPMDRDKGRDMVFCWPVDRSKFWLSSFFGPRKRPNGAQGFHNGIDMASLKGTPVKAAAHGIIVEAQRSKGYGNTIVIAHNHKYRTRYAHLSKIMVSVGQKVKRGQLIGKVGDTGFVRKSGKDASHLHFEVYAFGKKVNPMYFLG